MKSFKFFEKVKSRRLNHYLGFDMDECVINILRYKQYHNESILYNDTPLVNINVPIVNCFIRILTWRYYPNVNPEMIEIDYRVLEVNATTPGNFVLRMEVSELLRRIQDENI